MTARELILEVQNEQSGILEPPEDYLYAEYYALLAKLTLLLPGSDAEITLTPVDGKLICDLVPMQVRRVFTGETELLRGSAALLSLLPQTPLYHPVAGEIAVTVDTPCTVRYRRLPDDDADADFPLSPVYLPLVRAWLCHRACLYLGDYARADAFGTEYNRMVGEYKAENGVTV